MSRVRIRTLLAIAVTLLLGCVAACGAGSVPAAVPTDTPAPKGLMLENVFYSPPEPYNGKTYVVIEGTLTDGCTIIEEIDHAYEAHTVAVEVTTSRSEDADCNQAAMPFRETLRVETGDMYSGTYTVTVNGEVFTFDMGGFEFLVPETPDPGS